MPITYPLDLPDSIGIADITIRALNASAQSRSPFSFHSQTLNWGGECWAASIILPPMKRDLAADWYAFLISLRGYEGTFSLGDPNATTKQGAGAPGSPTVNGGGQTGYTLSINSSTTSQADFIKAGDYLQLGTGANKRLHVATQDASTGGLGNATVDIWPALRSSPTDGTNVDLINAKGIFRLASPVVEYNINSISSYGISFDCIEVV